MAFLGQLSGRLQSLKEKTVSLAEGAPGLGQQLQNLKVVFSLRSNLAENKPNLKCFPWQTMCEDFC